MLLLIKQNFEKDAKQRGEMKASQVNFDNLQKFQKAGSVFIEDEEDEVAL